MQDLSDSSFTGSSNFNNQGYLRAKGINFAYFNTNLGGGNFATQQQNDTNYISMKNYVNVKVTLPSVSLINAIWWSTSNKDSTNGVIVQFGKVDFNGPPVMGNNNGYTYNNLPSNYQAEDQGNSNLQVTYLKNPILTSQLTFSHIDYTASPQSGQSIPHFNDGHNVLLQMELFGCNNYDITQG